MGTFRFSEDIVTVSEFKSKAAEWLRHLETSKRRLVITQNGKAAGVVLSPKVYDDLMERLRFVDAVDQGLEDIAQKRTKSHESLVAEMKSRYGE